MVAHPADPPPLPRALRAPEPVIVVGMIAWLVASILVATLDLGGEGTLAVCLVGLGVGIFGTAIVAIQRAAVRRGAPAAQQGLD